jgi:hypothetical protein
LTASGIAIFIVLFSVIVMRQDSSCPNCKAGFAMSEVKRELKNRKRVGQTWVTNIDVTKKCRKCKHLETGPLIIEEPVNDY